MIICICGDVKEKEIRKEAKKGKRLIEIKDCLPIGKDCGKCLRAVKQIIQDEKEDHEKECRGV